MKALKLVSKIIAVASTVGMLTTTAAMAQEVYVEGSLFPIKGGFELITDSGQQYNLEGRAQDIALLAPRKVQVIGDLEVGPSGRTIKVKTVENAQP